MRQSIENKSAGCGWKHRKVGVGIVMVEYAKIARSIHIGKY